MLKHLFPQKIKDTGKRLCIIVSRTALAQQYKQEAAELEDPMLLKKLSSLGLREQNRFGSIDIFTYQALYHMLQMNPHRFFQQYGAVVMDECHFFIQDASFNEYTRETLELILKNAQHCIRLYLTATPEICLDEIIAMENRYRSVPNLDFLTGNYGNKAYEFQLYYFDVNYDYLKPCFFKEDREIVNIIKADSTPAKYLICVDTKPQGQALLKMFGSDIADYIDADLKETTKADVVESIIQNEKFDTKVLITTSFLDVGINLTDDYLQNIVIYSTDKTHFIQSIGRKRKQSNQTVFLFIHIPSWDDLQNYLKTAQCKLNELSLNISNHHSRCPKIIDRLPESFYLKLPNNELLYNSFALTYWQSRVEHLHAMLERLEETPNSCEAFARHYLSWINAAQRYCETHWLGVTPEESSKELYQLLELNCNRDLSMEEYSSFQKSFHELYNKLFPDDKIRNSRPPHLNILNKKLNKLRLPFVVQSCGKQKCNIKKG